MNEIAPGEIAVNLKAEQVKDGGCPRADICKNLRCKHRLGRIDPATEERIEERLTNFYPEMK